MKEVKNKEKLLKRYTFCQKFVLFFLRPVLKVFYGYKFPKPISIEGPYLVLSNHNTDLDAGLVTSCFKDYICFLASENCFRKGLKSKLLAWAFGPISKIKGASDTLAVMKSIRTLKEGTNLCIFPEGNRSFNGKTGKIDVAIGKLTKISGAKLVTFKITGGYFRIPRWGFTKRRGEWSGQIVNIYTPEQLKAMTAEQVTDIINKDLYENAYETQAKNPKPYKGKKLAYGMECALCVCPECKSIGRIKTDNNSVFCTNCNLKTDIDEYCYFGKGFPFHTVEEWDSWQEDFYRSYIKERENLNEPLFYDDEMSFRTVSSEHETTELGTGRFGLYKDHYFFKPTEGEEISLPIKDIPDCSVFNRTNYNFTDTKGLHYEVYTKNLVNVRKYLSVWRVLREEL
ncbi:MAG: 1-acyl-sn-glycerol-3-phosphate acyltransferase [Treponema sp.]|nr:1-acyl-sn-glycerol-3-phosphate acyltransferase [Treponema sp.]